MGVKYSDNGHMTQVIAVMVGEVSSRLEMMIKVAHASRHTIISHTVCPSVKNPDYYLITMISKAR